MTTGTGEPIGLCLSGIISAEIALSRLLIDGTTVEQIVALVAARRPEPETIQWRSLSRLILERTEALRGLAEEIAACGSDHLVATGTSDDLERITQFFDRAVAYSPEASVALHSLGDPRILTVATQEIVDWLTAEELLGADVLDLGCGIGRIAALLAPHCRSVLGLDVSAGMIAEARRRGGSLPGLRFQQTSGKDLEDLNCAAFDLILAVDSFPYMVQAGVADALVAGAARRLLPGGALIILNLSYRADLAADCADLDRWAADHALDVVHAGVRPFRLWDGSAFTLRRPTTSQPL